MSGIPSFKVRNGTEIGNYKVTQYLGTGWEGEVYRVIETYSGGHRVLKLFNPADYRSKQMGMYSARFEKLTQVSGVIKYYHADYWEDRDAYYLVMEYFAGKDLETLCQKPFPVFKALKTVRSLYKIINDCHEIKVCIGDIHPGNILMNGDGQVEIIDIDFSVEFTKETIILDVVAISKMLYVLIGNNSDIPADLRDVLPMREDAIRNRYSSAKDVLDALDELMGK